MGKSRKGGKRRPSMAERADIHDLYQRSVQCVEAEIDFVDDTYRSLRGRRARVLREDFCGTANTSCEWVRRRKRNRAIGVDISQEVLEWGRSHNVSALGSGAKRLQLVCADVMQAQTEPADALLAMNFSYWLFQDRGSLRAYFERTRANLAEDGVLFLDAYGGSEAIRITRDRHKYDGFTYIWDQAFFDPITNHMRCHIHFRFPDGSRLDEAFSYEWRLWTLPEIREVLLEAGYARATVYWQGTDEETGDGDGVFEPAEEGEPDPDWIAYVVAESRH
jgi:SAM-dependent methyltransferase